MIFVIFAGITESSITALIIFSIHMASLIILIVTAFVYAFTVLDIFMSHFQTFKQVDKWETLKQNYYAPQPNSIGAAIFLGFASGMVSDIFILQATYSNHSSELRGLNPQRILSKNKQTECFPKPFGKKKKTQNFFFSS